MKNNRIFDVLRNNDASQSERLEKYIKLDEKESERIFRKSRAKYNLSVCQDAEDFSQGDSVSGAEIYRNQKWRRITAAASAVIISGAVISGVAILLKNLKTVDSPELSDNSVISENTPPEAITSPPPDTDSEEITKPVYKELAVHHEYFFEDKTEDEVFDIVNQNRYTRDFSDRTPDIDREYYISLIETASPDTLNSDINKTYIYHMMLNSIDYYDSAEGNMEHNSLEYDYSENVNFSIDMLAQYSHMECKTQHGEESNSYETYHDRIKSYYIYPDDKTFSQENYDSESFEYTTNEDDYRVVKYADETYGTLYISSDRKDFTNLNIYSDLLFPQSIASSGLFEFENWNIDSVGEWNGRKTALISGGKDEYYFNVYPYQPYKFRMEIDLETGILLSFAVYDINDNEKENFSIKELSLNVEIDKILPNIEQYRKDGYTEYLLNLYRGNDDIDNTQLAEYAEICREFCKDYSKAYNFRDGSSLEKYTDNENLQKYLKQSVENQIVESIPPSDADYEIYSIHKENGCIIFTGYYGDSEGRYGMAIFLFDVESNSLKDVYWYTKGSYDQIYRSRTDETGYDIDFWNDRIRVEGLFKNVGIKF